jgi:phosphate transport system protein
VRQFAIELEELNRRLLEMGRLVESAIDFAVRSLLEQNVVLAEEVIRGEPKVNGLEIEIDGMATRLIALYQPVARDLRLLTAAIKINTNLERVGDLAMHIAERSLATMNHPLVKSMADIPKIGSLAQSMLLNCLDAFVRGDADLAHSVLLTDDEVDQLRDKIHVELMDIMRREPTQSSVALDLLFIARNLERIGDHATNIAEEVLFVVKGVDVRHHAQQDQSPK